MGVRAPGFLTVLLFCAAAAGPLSAGQDGPVDADRIAGVYAARPAGAAMGLAVRQVQLGMKQLYGLDLKEIEDAGAVPADRPVVVLGRKAALALGAASEKNLADLGFHGYAILCGGTRIVIAGDDDWATYYGVLGFLEQLGMRFYLPDPNKAYAPKPPTRAIGPFTLRDRPAFGFRNGWSTLFRQCHPLLGDPRRGLDPELFDPKKTGSDLWLDHTAGYLVPKLLFYDAHPEYYAMRKDGTRIPKKDFSDHRTPLCLSNPDVTKISIERALAWMEKNPDQRFFQITNGDTGFWCQCPECLKLDPAPGEFATRLLHWVNPVARAVAAKYPDKIVMTLAYAGSDKAPAVARPEKNVWMIAAVGAGSLPFWAHSMARDEGPVGKILDWIAVAPGRVTVCEYHGAYEPAMIDKSVGRLRYYRKIGLRGINATYGSPPNFRPLFGYVWSKLNWNPDLDGLALAKDFIGFYYGAAAEPIARFFDLTHARYEATLASKEPLAGGYPPDFYSPAFVRAALACFNEAAAAAGTAVLKKEIRNEQELFLGDVVSHMPAYDFSEGAKKELLEYLGHQRTLAKELGKDLAFLRATQALAMGLEKKQAGYRGLIEEWLGASADMQPVKLENGLRFAPQMFRGCDYGPDAFPGGTVKSHKDFPSPPKVCAGVYMKTTGGHGQQTSSRMTVDFDVDAASAGRAAVLDVEGQDAISHWMGDNGKDWKTSIEITVNGTKIFSGECGLVRGNWSRREFAVPAGILKAGKNRIEIRNVSPRGWFAGCWFLLSDAVLAFK